MSESQAIVRLYPNPEQGDEVLDIIFLHGIGGNWRKTWLPRRFDEKQSFWPIALGEALRKERFNVRVLTVDYPARKFGKSSGIKPQAEYVLGQINKHGTSRPVLFICHSLGGLIVKKMLQLSESKAGTLPQRTRAILFLGTPHRGARVAWWLRFFGLGSKTLHQLRTRDDILIDLGQQFCRQFGEHQRQPGLVGAGLPSEAEWEAACRAGTGSAFNNGKGCTAPTGMDPALDEVGWFKGNSGGETKPVKQKRPNEWGLYDMHGNVWEWCVDGLGREYTETAQTDPVGSEDRVARVVRGGSWVITARLCRSACRNWSNPGFRSRDQGFRLLAGRAKPPPEATRR